MMSIGAIARATGVSRRMLRHWEQAGVLEPARVDPRTGYRRYAASQTGRVHAVAALRQLGFGLDDIAALLSPTVEHLTLERTLRAQAAALEEQIAEASTRLIHVQQRLDDLQHGSRQIAMNLTETSLPTITLTGCQATVLDETEIPGAVDALRSRLRLDQIAPATTLVLAFDGTADDAIVVTAGVDQADAPTGTQLTDITLAAETRAVSVLFEQPPARVSDAWTAIDAHLGTLGLRSHGVYRQLVSPGGSVTLQAPVRAV